MKKFHELSEREVLALAIALEEEDERVYADFAEGLRQDYPASAAMFEGMREEESGHRRRLIDLYRQKFGEHIPLIRRQDVRGGIERERDRTVPEALAYHFSRHVGQQQQHGTRVPQVIQTDENEEGRDHHTAASAFSTDANAIG